MTTAEIEVNADIGGISSPDLNLMALLRQKITPRFLHDVGYVSWRRKVASVSISAAGLKGPYPLPAGVEFIELVSLAGATPGLQYIGENAEALMAAEANVNPPGAPTQYYLGYDASTGEQNQLYVNCTPNATIATYIVYYQTSVFADLTTSVNMNKYVPLPYQWALVEALQKEIFFHRFGINDPRYIAAEREYTAWVENATDNKERARRNKAVYAK